MLSPEFDSETYSARARLKMPAPPPHLNSENSEILPCLEDVLHELRSRSSRRRLERFHLTARQPPAHRPETVLRLQCKVEDLGFRVYGLGFRV